MTAVPTPLLTLVLISSLVLGACSDNDDVASDLFPTKQEPETWRFALEEIGGSVQDAWAQEFRRRMEDISDGQVQVEIYPYGSIGTSPHLTRLVTDGRVHLAFASAGHIAEEVPEAGVFLLPFLLPEDDQAAREILTDGELRDLLSAAWADAGLKLMSLVPEGWMSWTANRPLLQPADFSGLRMRTMTAPVHGAVFEAWGAEAITMPYGEVHEALQLGQVDGQSNPVFAITEMKFQEVQSDITLPRASRFITSIISNHEWYQNLDSTRREWLQEASRGLPEFVNEVQRDYNQRSLEQLRQSGRLGIHSLSDEQRDAFRQASKPAVEAYREQAGERGQQVLDRIQTLTKESSQAQNQ